MEKIVLKKEDTNLDKEITIELDPLLSPGKNLEKYFKDNFYD